MDNKTVGSARLIQEFLDKSRGFQLKELEEIGAMAAEYGGALASVADFDGEWCGTGKIHFRWPPKKKLGAFIDELIARDIVFDVFRYGIPRPEGVFIEMRRQLDRLQR